MTREDIDKAITYFKMRLAEKTHPPITAQQKAFTIALETLEEIKEMQWIPITEGMPDECYEIKGTIVPLKQSKLVNITVHDLDTDELFVCNDNTVDGRWCCFGDSDYKVIAWMPLPDPYIGSDK